jgi:hypothetical protein
MSAVHFLVIPGESFFKEQIVLNRSQPRVIEMKRPDMPRPNDSGFISRSRLRAEMDGLTIRLARERGIASQATIRAEQISHAIQRLEWALQREGGHPTAG